MKWHNRLIKPIWCLLACAFLFIHSASAELEIEITQATNAAIPIAIVPFKWTGNQPATPQNIEEVVSGDLSMSGEFKVLPLSSIRDLPTTAAQVNMGYWRGLGMDYLTIGTVTALGGDSYRVNVALLDLIKTSATEPIEGSPAGVVPNQPKEIFAKEFLVSGRYLRNLSHHISDLIYEQLTGHRGAFSTLIAYVNVQYNTRTGPPSRYVLEISDVDGYNPRPLLTSREPIMSPAWSPDGKRLAYVSFEKNRSAVYSSEISTGKRRLGSS